MKTLYKSARLILILGLLVILGVQTPSLAKAQTPTHKTVLLLFPYQFDLAATELETQAIQSEFGQATDLTLDVYAEYLDFNRFQGEAYWQQLAQLYASKYGQKPIDLVLAGNEAALNWWLKYRAPIAPNAPVVVYDIATDRLTALSLPPEVTGVSGMVDYVQSVQWILRARPAVKEVVLVHGVGPADQRYHSEVDTLQAALRGQVQFSDLSDQPLAEIKQHVATLPQTTVVLAMPMFEDAAGIKYRPSDALRQLAAASSVPVLSGYDQFIGTGTIGGFLYSVEQQARDAAQLGLRLLRGQAASAIPPVSHQSSRPIFDHLALQRFNIPLSILPPDSVVKNRQYSLWEQYQPQIIAVSAGFTILLLLVVILLGALALLQRARSALQESERFSRSALDALTGHIAILDATGTILHVNRAWRTFARENGLLLPEDGVGSNYLAACEPGSESASAFARGIRAVIRGEEDLYEQEYDCHAPHEQRWFIGRVTRFQEPGPVRIVVAHNNITERKLVQIALQDSERRLRATIDRSGAGYFRIGRDGRFQEVNAAWLYMHGYAAPADVIGQHFALTQVDTDLEQAQKAVQALLDGAPIPSGEFSRRREDGSIGYHTFSAAPVMQAGQIIGLDGFLMDITDRVHAEQERQRAEDQIRQLNADLEQRVADRTAELSARTAELQQSEALYHSILTASPDGISMTEMDDRLRTVSPMTVAMFGGTSEADILNRPFYDFIVPEDRERARANTQLKLQGKRAGPGEYQAVRLDGSRFDIEVSGKAIRNANGQPVSIVYIVRDITQRKQTEEALRQSEARFKALFTNHSVVMLLIHPFTGTILEANPAAEAFYGYSRQQLTQLSIDTINAMAPADVKAMREQARRKERSYFVFPHRLASGEVRTVEVHSSPVVNAGQTVLFSIIHDITERKQAEEALRQSEAALRASEARTAAILRLSPIVIGVSTLADGRYLEVNEAFERMLGYSQAETVGRTSSDLNLWAEADTRATLLQEIRAHGRVEHLEVRLRRKSGEIFPALIFLTPIDFQDTTCLITMMLDITERKQAEEALHQSEETLRALLNAIPDSAFLMTPDGTVLNANETVVQRLHAGSVARFIGQNVFKLLPPEVVDYRRQRAAEVVQTKQPVRFEDVRDGRNIDTSFQPVFDETGQVTRLAVFGYDITERRQAEESLRESEERYRLLAQNATDLIWTTDMVMRLNYISPSVTRLLGFTVEEALARSMQEAYTAASLALAEQTFAETMASERARQTPPGASRRLELELYRKDGTTVPVEANFSFLRAATGEPVGLLAIVRDITARRRAETALARQAQELAHANAELEQRVEARTAELRQANEALTRALRVKDEFLATMSHELRTPLTGVLGLTDSLQMELFGPLTDAQLKPVQAIHASGQRLLDLVTMVLDYSRLMAGQLELQIDTVEVEWVCQASVRMIQAAARQKNLQVTVSRAVGAYTVQADGARLKQMLFQLLSNAVKFTPPGGAVELEVTCGASSRSEVLFTVWDTGSGIAPEDQGRLFQPFVQLDSRLARHYEGAGLGLALVQRLAEMHSGQITVESEGVPGKGSRFTLSLPCLSGSSLLAQSNPPPESQVEVQPSS